MNPFFLVYKSIAITWFMVLTSGSIIISYFIVNILWKDYEEDQNKIEDIFMILVIIGFSGARVSYALMNFNLYKDNIFSIFKISRYNLSLVGGIVFSLLALVILSKKYKISFEKLLRIFVIPFYFSMAIGVWVLMFDRFLLPLNYMKNGKLEILYGSLLFLIGMVLELTLPKRIDNKYTTITILGIVVFLYYLIW